MAFRLTSAAMTTRPEGCEVCPRKRFRQEPKEQSKRHVSTLNRSSDIAKDNAPKHKRDEDKADEQEPFEGVLPRIERLRKPASQAFHVCFSFKKRRAFARPF
jgi:hypothetical protein